MRAFKVALIVFFSIIGIVGATVLGLYLTGKFEAPKIPPTDIYFADLSTNEAGENVFVAHEGGYETSNNFEMILSTSSADSTLNNVELGFLGVNNTLLRKYVKVNNETETPFCYTLDANGALVKYSLTSAEEATHVADPDGKVVVPKIVKLNKAFMVLTCVAPDDDFSGVIDETTPMYIKGGEVSLHAQSEHKLLSKIDTKINIDVPVSNITVLPRTDNGGNDSLLQLVDGEYYLVNLESLFGLNIEFTPKRSAYLFGKDGSNGEVVYKKVLISLNNDETHFELINNDGIKVEGVSDILRLRSLVAGKGQINVRAYKNGTDCREFAGLTLQEQYDRLAEIGISETVFVKVDEVGINGFEITTDYKEVGEELEFSVNNKLYLTANGLSDKYNSLGINILAEENYSAGLIQKEIANIYLSVEINGVDATAESNKYFEFVGSEVVTDTDAGKNYYKVIFNANVPNNSYWEIVALKETDLNVEIKVYYRNPDGTFASGGNFGPYSINGVVLSMVQAEVEWNVGDLITSDNAVANERNEVIIFFDESGNPIPVQYDIANFAKITNLNEKPAYTKIKYFALSKDTSLENKINCKKYEGKIEGVSLENDVCVYELLSIEKLEIRSMDNLSEYEFDLFFGVVLDHLGEAIVSDGGYQVVVLPTEDNGDLKTLPFRVSKTVGIDKIVADIVQEDLNGNGTLDDVEDSNGNGKLDDGEDIDGDGRLDQDEDSNGNGILDDGEDIDGDGKLDNGEKDINNNGRIDNYVIKPYGGDGVYVLQKTEDSIEIAITINSDDEEIFKKQVQLGNIVLKAYCEDEEFSGLYYSKGGKIALQDALAVALENLNENDIKTDEKNNNTTIKLRLSVDLIADFQGTVENEKVVVIKLEYNVKNGKEESVDEIVLSAGEVRIYSGKIQNVSIEGIVEFKTEEGVEHKKELIQGGSTIQINKKIENGEFITEYLLNGENGKVNAVDLFNESDALKGLNIILDNVDGWGIDDAILVDSTNSAVLSVSTTTYGDKTAYCITPLKSGTAKLTITPNYKHSEFGTYEINFIIDAQFEIDDNDAEFRQQQVDGDTNPRGILSYQENFGYTFIGAPITASGNSYVIAGDDADDDDYLVYRFASLVKLKAKKGDGEVNCTSMLKFSINSNDADLEEYIDFVYEAGEAGELVGFKVKQKFGRAGSFTVYYHSAELGYNAGVLKINIQPYWRAECELSDQLTADQIENVSNKIGNLIAGSKFVYAETTINLSTFKIYGYDLKKKVYNIPDGNFLLGTTLTPSAMLGSYAPLGSEIRFTTEDGIAIASLKVDENNPYKPASIEFFALNEEKTYTLTLLNLADAGNKYNFAVDYTFVVCPNIKVGGDLTADENGVYNLNTLYHNGNEISWPNENATIEFVRLYDGSSNFSSDNFSFKNYLVGKEDKEFTQGTKITEFTISGVTELSHYELVISYGGKEFKFRYYAEPNIVSFEDKDTVVYDEETYISLYAGMDVSGWGANVDFGKLVSNNSILTMKDLNAFDGTKIFIDGEVYKAFDGSELTINKNKHGLFEVYVVATGENNAYIVRKAIIFPANWGPYVKYFDKNGEVIDADVKSILEGDFKTEITSGERLSGFATILTGNTYSYEIKDINTGAVLDKDNNTLIKVENIAVGEGETLRITPHIITYASGKDAEYEIAFTVDVQGYNYEFKYFVEVSESQQIKINYPYHAEPGNGDVLLEDFDKSHIIYYDEFNSNNIYNINLLSSNYNMFGRQYVYLLEGEEVANNNKLSFKICSLLVNGEVIFEIVNGEVISKGNYENYVKLNGSNVEINSSNTIAPMNITIEVSTENGAVEYYKILTQTRLDEYGLYTEETNSETNETILTPFDITTIKGAYDLSNILLKQKIGDSVSDAVDLTLNWAVLNKEGILQTENDLIYIKETKDADGKIISRELVVKPYPNAIKATLCAFSENGIVAQVELDVPSPIVISQKIEGNNSAGNPLYAKVETIDGEDGETYYKFIIYADQTITLTEYLSILVGEDTDDNKVDDIASGNFTFDLKGSSDIVSIKEVETKDDEGNDIVVYKLTILPHAGDEFEIKISVSVFDENILPGTRAGNGEQEAITANGTLSFTIKPNIVVEDKTTEVYANDENFEYKIVNNNIADNNLFTGGDSSYTYSVVDVTSTLEQPELNLYGNNFTADDFKNFIISKFNTGTKTLKFTPLAVSANKRVVITFQIAKDSNEDGVITLPQTGTLTIIIKPDCNVLVNYPNYGTGQVMGSHLVYYGDYVGKGGTLTLEEDNLKVEYNRATSVVTEESVRVPFGYWITGAIQVDEKERKLYGLYAETKDQNLKFIVKTDGYYLQEGTIGSSSELYLKKTSGDAFGKEEIVVIAVMYNDAEKGNLVAKVSASKTESGQDCLIVEKVLVKNLSQCYDVELTSDLISITDNVISIDQQVEQNKVVEIAVKVDGLIRAKYSLEICASQIFSAKFTENGLNEDTEEFVEKELTDLKDAGNNHFGIIDGTIKVTTKANCAGQEFIIPVIARDRRTGIETVVYVCGQGSEISQKAKLYFAQYNETTKMWEYSTTNAIGDSGDDQIYTFAEIFSGKNLDIDMCEFYPGDYKEYSGVVAWDAVVLTQPSQKITFYFNEHQIPFSVANTLVMINTSETLETFRFSEEEEGKKIATFTLRVGGNQLARYELTIVEDYNFNQNAFVSLPDDEEFEKYDTTTTEYKVSSTTIVLEAGTSYSLLELLLSDNFGLTSYRHGKDYSKETELTLIHGEYKTNDISFSELISLQSKVETVDEITYYDYIITPNGAQNDGDIVHLLLRFGEETKTYIIQIKIIPNIEITVEGTGEKTIKYKNDGGNLKNVLLSELVNVENVDISNLIVSVGESGSLYVNGTGSNRLASWTSGEGESQTTVYGIQLKRTIFGGHIINLTIGDRFGYKEELTIQYLNESELSPQIIENPREDYEFKDSIFEGDDFEILFKIGDKYYSDPQGTYECELEPNSIIIDNFGTGENGIDVSGLTSFGTSTTSKLGEITGNAIGYYNNEIFKTDTTLDSDEFGFKIVLNVENGDITETLELPVEIKLNQRYKVVPKSPYNEYSEIYLGVGNEYLYTDLFRICDYKTGEYSELSSGDSSYTPSATDVTFRNKVSDSFEQRFTFTVKGILHDYTFNIVLTPKYYEIETPADYYGIFGKVVDGENVGFTTWSAGFIFLDYYGNPIESLTNPLTDPSTDPSTYFENYSVSEGAGSINNGVLSGLLADEPITISVKSNEVEIGEIKVTMRQYDALNSSIVTAVPGDGETNLLNFATWMNGIKARITGTSGENAIYKDIPSGSSWFSFECETSGYEIVTGEDREYKLKKRDGNFSPGDRIWIKVSYLGKELGTIDITVGTCTAINTNNVNVSTDSNKIAIADWAKGIQFNVNKGTYGQGTEDLIAYKNKFTYECLPTSYSFNENLDLVKAEGQFEAGDAVQVKISYLGKELKTFVVSVALSVEKDVETILPTPTLTGYTFEGWFTRWCSELYEKYISGYNGTRVNVSYDDCNPFGMIAGDFGEIASLSKHTSKTASNSTIVAFNSLSELFATFMNNFEIPTDGSEYIPTISDEALEDYTQFYNKAIELYNSALVSFAKNVSNNLTRSAVIGVNHPYTMAFGTDVSPELIDFQAVIANLFGFSSKSEFMNYAQNLANTYAEHRTNITNSATTNEALENGCFYTSNGSFVFPIAVQNELSSTVLAYVILDTSGLVSVWINDITAALWATNFNSSYHTDSIINNKLYCKNILFVTGPFTQVSDGTKVGDGGATYTPTASTTLYAQWTANTYTVTLDPGVSGLISYAPSGSYSGNNASISWNGEAYTFTNTSTSDPYVQIGSTVYLTAGTTYSMHMNIYNSSGAALSSSAGSVQIFYAINGSFSEDNSKRIGAPGGSVTFTVSTTGTYNIRLDNDCGQNIIIKDFWIQEASVTLSATATYGAPLPTITVPTREGYKFEGYFTKENGEGVKYYNADGTSARIWNIAENTTLYAMWTNGYIITLDSQGVSTPGDGKVLAIYGSAMPAITPPTKIGYTFEGYFTAEVGGTQYYNADGTSAKNWDSKTDTTLYAHWTPNRYTVSFDANGGSGGQSASVTATYDSAMPSISTTAPTKTGYTFGGWYDTSAETGGTQYYTEAGASARTWNKTANTTLHARWTPNTYTITFDQQGGSGGTESTTATYGAALPTITVPTRTGYTFGGYFTEENGGGTQYYNTDGISDIVWVITTDLTLYAKWIANTYTVSFDANGGSGGQSANVTATYDSAMPSISTTAPTKTGYTFGGWYDTSAETGGTQYYTAEGASARNWDIAENTTLYARWIEGVEVTFIIEESSYYEDVSITINGETTSLTEVESYTFTLYLGDQITVSATCDPSESQTITSVTGSITRITEYGFQIAGMTGTNDKLTASSVSIDWTYDGTSTSYTMKGYRTTSGGESTIK